MAPESSLSLSELNRKVRETIKSNFESTYWVTAEITDIRENQSGHCFLELIEKNSVTDQIVAKAKGIVWSYTWRMLRPFFEETTHQPLSTGLKILINVAVDFHEIYGFNLTVRDIDPAYTLGDVEKKRREILTRLKSDGVLTMNKELEFPAIPQRIAIITSETAAGYEDFLSHLKHNEAGYVFYTKIFPATMQGNAAESSVIDALDRVFRFHHFFDLVVIIRGGGAKSELLCFDSYWLAYHITQFPIPVVTGIGHERDESIADLVANLHFKTPTATAQYLIEKVTAFENYLETITTTIQRDTRNKISVNQSLLAESVLRFVPVVKDLLFDTRSQLESQVSDLRNHVSNKLKENSFFNSTCLMRLKNAGNLKISAGVTQLKLSTEQLKKQSQLYIQHSLSSVSHIENKIRLVDPQKVLERGFSISRINKKTLHSAKEGKHGQYLETILHDGKLISTINVCHTDDN